MAEIKKCTFGSIDNNMRLQFCCCTQQLKMSNSHPVCLFLLENISSLTLTAAKIVGNYLILDYIEPAA